MAAPGSNAFFSEAVPLHFKDSSTDKTVVTPTRHALVWYIIYAACSF